jgi:hypothetical protein
MANAYLPKPSQKQCEEIAASYASGNHSIANLVAKTGWSARQVRKILDDAKNGKCVVSTNNVVRSGILIKHVSNPGWDFHEDNLDI